MGSRLVGSFWLLAAPTRRPIVDRYYCAYRARQPHASSASARARVRRHGHQVDAHAAPRASLRELPAPNLQLLLMIARLAHSRRTRVV